MAACRSKRKAIEPPFSVQVLDLGRFRRTRLDDLPNELVATRFVGHLSRAANSVLDRRRVAVGMSIFFSGKSKYCRRVRVDQLDRSLSNQTKHVIEVKRGRHCSRNSLQGTKLGDLASQSLISRAVEPCI